MIITCPLPDSLLDIPQPECPFQIEQIARFFFQQRQPLASPTFATLTEAQTLTAWQALLDATDATKIVVSPIVSGVTITPSEALTTGGNDNTTFAGIPDYNGEGFVQIAGQFKNTPPATKRALDALTQFSIPGVTGLTNLTFGMADISSKAYLENPAAGTTYRLFECFNFRVSSVGYEGFNTKNLHNFSFGLRASWADYMAIIKPAFDPLSDI